MLRPGHGLILIVVALLTFAVVMVNSAGLTIQDGESISLARLALGRPTILAGIALVALVAGCSAPVRRLGGARGLASPVPWIILVSIGLLIAVHVPGLAREVNGARRWITLGPVSFQPSEIAKWGLPVVLASYAAGQGHLLGRLGRGFLPLVALLALVCLLVATEDLGTAVLIGMVGVALLIAAGARLWHVGLLAPVGAAGVAGLMIASPYRLDRLRAFLDPFADPQGVGYHMIQSMAAVSGGGLAGRGLGNSIQKFGYLPEDTTDFIFAIICEELGLAGAALVVCLYGGLLLCGLAIVRRERGAFERLLGLGILLTIGLQALINLAVVTGTAPTKGIALPLLSAGGTGWVLTAFSVGLLVSLDRTRQEHLESCGADRRPDVNLAGHECAARFG